MLFLWTSLNPDHIDVVGISKWCLFVVEPERPIAPIYMYVYIKLKNLQSRCKQMWNVASRGILDHEDYGLNPPVLRTPHCRIAITLFFLADWKDMNVPMLFELWHLEGIITKYKRNVEGSHLAF